MGTASKAVCCVLLSLSLVSLSACGPTGRAVPSPTRTSAEGARTPVPVPPGEASITREQVYDFASRLVALDNAFAGPGTYDAAGFAEVVDCRSVTDQYLDAALAAASDLASSSPGPEHEALFEAIRTENLEWHRWSEGKSQLDIAGVVVDFEHGRPAAVSDALAARVGEAHDLALSIEAVDRDFGVSSEDGHTGRTLPVAKFRILPGARVELLTGNLGRDASPITYDFAKGADGQWRVVGFDQENLVGNVREFLALNE